MSSAAESAVNIPTRLRARWVIPVCRPPINDGVVEIHAGRIRSVQPFRRVAGLPCTDLGEVTLLPGLVNVHTHLELTAFAGTLPRSDLWSWLLQITTRSKEQADVSWADRGVRQGAELSLRSGTTCVGDVSRLGRSWRTLAELPIRKCCFCEMVSISDRPPRNLMELTAVLDELPPQPGMLWPGVSPHAPYTASSEGIAQLAALARQRDLPWAIHLAETVEEIEWLVHGRGPLVDLLQRAAPGRAFASPRCRPVELLRRCKALGKRALIVHGNYLSGEDLDLLAKHGGTIVYCPRANRWFGHRDYPLRAMLERGIPVVLGTDSLASNESLSVLDELIYIRQAHSELGFDQALAMGTSEAARALGAPAGCGTLQPDGPADLVAVAGPEPHGRSYEACLDPGVRPVAVWVAGRHVLPE